MSKILWVDLETTGTNSIRHAIIQLAALVEIDGTIVEELDMRMRPLSKHDVDQEALDSNNTTEEEINSYPAQDEQFPIFKALLERYVKRYEKLDKFVLAGYNVNFDDDFLRAMFLDNAATRNDRKYKGYFGSYFFWPKRDAQTYLAEHIAENNLRLPIYRLETVCAYFNIPIDAHDALSDIQATRTLYRVLRYSISTVP